MTNTRGWRGVRPAFLVSGMISGVVDEIIPSGAWHGNLRDRSRGVW